MALVVVPSSPFVVELEEFYPHLFDFWQSEGVVYGKQISLPPNTEAPWTHWLRTEDKGESDDGNPGDEGDASSGFWPWNS